jgi:hypothetical protein
MQETRGLRDWLRGVSSFDDAAVGLTEAIKDTSPHHGIDRGDRDLGTSRQAPATSSSSKSKRSSNRWLGITRLDQHVLA